MDYYRTPHGKSYHRVDCQTLKRSKKVDVVSATTGLLECKVCLGKAAVLKASKALKTVEYLSASCCFKSPKGKMQAGSPDVTFDQADHPVFASRDAVLVAGWCLTKSGAKYHRPDCWRITKPAPVADDKPVTAPALSAQIKTAKYNQNVKGGAKQDNATWDKLNALMAKAGLSLSPQLATA